jgi:hypothetical protein
MLSYRDPHLVETLEVYAGAVDFLRSGGLSDTSVEASRIGVVGDYDKPLSPAQQMGAARSWRWQGLSDDDRMRFRDGLLTVTAAKIVESAVPVLESALQTAPRAILAPKERLEQANAALGGALELFTPEPG